MPVLSRILPGLLVAVCALTGCARTARDLSLNPQLARSSLDQALKAWTEGKRPGDLQPEITMGDSTWVAGTSLTAYTIKTMDERSDGTNLYLPVVLEFKDARGKVSRTDTTYIVGTSPSITIFPQ